MAPPIQVRRPLSLLVAACALLSGATRADDFWSTHVEPILRDHCLKCHSGDKPKSGLDLSTLQGALRGGDAGPAVIPGNPDASPLIRLSLAGADPQMPPKGDLLSAEKLDLLRTGIIRLGTNTAAPVTETKGEPEAPTRKALRWTPPASMAPEQVVDRFLELGWKERGVKPAREADERTFVRRAYLDLAGRIPTEAETSAYLGSKGRSKRKALVDTLLSGDDHVRHLREVWDVVLMGRTNPDRLRRRSDRGWHAYLEDAIRRNRPWNEVVREMIVARPAGESDRGAVWFLYERENNAQAMAEALAPVVFGVQIQCAQCHDHMVAREIKQAHYWGMVAAFSRSKNVDTPKGAGLAESAIGGFSSFANLKKETQRARLVFFNGRSVDEKWPDDGTKEADDPALYLVPPPSGKAKPEAPSQPRFSRRQELARAVTEDNPLLARATVNRVWALLFGRGLVHPVELMDSKHPASHPELLDWLAADFASHGHDVRRLIRILASTRAYALDSRPAAKRGAVRPPAPDAFARSLTRPISAEQLARSLVIATGSGQPDPTLGNALARQFPDLFASEYNASLQQAMFLSNSPEFDRLLADAPGSLVQRMGPLKSPADRVRVAFSAVLGRPPEPDELREATRYLADRPEPAGNRQLVWSLLTSAEFLLNH